jgi:ATP-dependent Clp protease ATP-binding subunit ClpB
LPTLRRSKYDLHQIGKDVVDGIQLIKKEIEDYKYDAERERDDYGKVAEIRYAGN